MADQPLANTPFREDLEALINKHSMENGSNTPDFVLATFLVGQLAMYDIAVRARDQWYSVHLEPGESHFRKPIPSFEDVVALGEESLKQYHPGLYAELQEERGGNDDSNALG